MKEKVERILQEREHMILNKYMCKSLMDYSKILEICENDEDVRYSFTYDKWGELEKITIKATIEEGYEMNEKIYHIFVF